MFLFLSVFLLQYRHMPLRGLLHFSRWHIQLCLRKFRVVFFIFQRLARLVLSRCCVASRNVSARIVVIPTSIRCFTKNVGISSLAFAIFVINASHDSLVYLVLIRQAVATAGSVSASVVVTFIFNRCITQSRWRDQLCLRNSSEVCCS